MIIRDSYPISCHVTGSKGMGWPSSFRPCPILPPPPFLFGFSGIVFDQISKIHIFGTKLKSCLETYFIRSRYSSAMKIFFCDEDIEKIYVRDSTVIRNNEIHRMYNEILDELGDLATVVSRNYVYGKIKDRTGLSIRHISRMINHTKVEEI